MNRLFIVAAIVAACCVSQISASPVAAAPAPKQVDTWAWCGMHPDDPAAVNGTRSMAVFAGIDATFGPCKEGAPGYRPDEPLDRYVAPDVYLRLVRLNAQFGMQTVVYDARIWSTDPAVRQAAKTFWRPVYEHIAAWDMGDEYDPNRVNPNDPTQDEWLQLIARNEIVLNDVALDSHVKPFSNHYPWAMDEALRDLRGQSELMSFDLYGGDQGVDYAKAFDAQVDVLMCAVNSYDHDAFDPTPASVIDDTRRLIAAGCDMILTFGGSQVYGSAFLGPKSTNFGPVSIIDGAGEPTPLASAVQEGNGYSNYMPVDPARLLETRSGPGLATVDGQSNAIGVRPAGTVTELQVSGRAGVRTDAASVVLTVTAINAVADGFLSVYPCGAARPNVAQVNHAAGTVVATTVVVKLPANGKVCLFNLAETDLVVDVAGYHPPGTTFTALQPARVLETRSGGEFTTVDNTFVGVGLRGANSVTQLAVAGRAGVPFGASGVTLSVTVANARAAGFVTAYPCDQARPPTASVNFGPGQVVTNAVVTGVAANGWVCLFTSADIDLVVDVAGFSPAGASFVPVAPVRALDTRTRPKPIPPQTAVLDPAIELPVTGLAGIPASASAVVINLTVTRSTRGGFVSIYPCGSTRPNASSINFRAGETVSNMIVAEIGLRGALCLFSSADPDYVVDITAYHP